MSYQLAYCDSLSTRCQEVLSDLIKSRGHVQIVESVTSIPPEAAVALVGVDDLKAAMPSLSWLVQDRPHTQVLLLWEGDDQQLAVEAMRHGVRDVITSPAGVPDAVQRAWGRLAKDRAGGTDRPGKVIAIFSLKGGIGKSTLSANLPVSIHKATRMPTIAIDLSLPCGNLEMYLDLRPTISVGDVLAAGKDLDQSLVKQALARHKSGIQLLAGPRPTNMEALANNSSRPMLELLTQAPGVVIVDVGAYIEEAHVTALEAADLVVVPVTPLISSLGTMPQAREFLNQIGVDNSRILPILNHAAPEAEPVPPEVVTKLLGERPRYELPWGGADVAASLNAGLPVCYHNPKSNLAKAIDNVAHAALVRLDLIDPMAKYDAAPSQGGAMGWFKSLFQQKGVAHVRP